MSTDETSRPDGEVTEPTSAQVEGQAAPAAEPSAPKRTTRARATSATKTTGAAKKAAAPAPEAAPAAEAPVPEAAETPAPETPASPEPAEAESAPKTRRSTSTRTTTARKAAARPAADETPETTAAAETEAPATTAKAPTAKAAPKSAVSKAPAPKPAQDETPSAEPAEKPAKPAPEPAKSEQPVTSLTTGRRVVVAEDEALIRLDVVETLTEAGFQVVGEAGDGETAVNLATELRPDVVVMDIKMPVLDGISAANKIGKARLAPVVLLTAFSQAELVERARDAGAMAYVVKPFTPAELLPAIEIAIARHAEITALESEVADLAERFETRKRVERAKGLLMTKMGLTEPESFRWIQKTSMDRRLTMREVADAVIEQVGGGSADKTR